MRRSISEVCGPDYGNDPTVLTGWLSNKTPENVSGWIANNGSYSIVAKWNAEIIGFALIREDEIMLMYVIPEFIGKGVGRKMLKAIESWASSEGVRELLCISTITAKRFYERNGFASAGEPCYVGGVLGEFALSKHIGT